MYLLELHCHSAPVSRCGKISAEELAAYYAEMGYQGMVLTNHINLATFTDREDLSWEEKVGYFLSGYTDLQKAASGYDLDVLLGCEINLSIPGQDYLANDYLVYGVTKEKLMELGDPRPMKLGELSGKIHELGMMMVQAHPFRYNTLIMNEELLDGVEVYNGAVGHDSHNYLTNLWADRKNLIRTSGSDFHYVGCSHMSGILTGERVRNNEQLLRILKSGAYSLILPQETK